MDPKLTELSQLFERFKAAFIMNDLETCSKFLSQLKVMLTEFRSLPLLFEHSPNAIQELKLASNIFKYILLKVLEDVRNENIYSSHGSHNFELLSPHGSSSKKLLREVKLLLPGSSSIVAIALLMSEDPTKVLSGRPLRVGWVEVIPKVVCVPGIALFRAQAGVPTLNEASLNGISVAWLREYVSIN